MKKVKDPTGQEIRGIYRGSKGELIVSDAQALAKYKTLKTKMESDKSRILKLESELSEIKELLNKVLQCNR